MSNWKDTLAKIEARITHLDVEVTCLKNNVCDLPLKKICPVCGRNILYQHDIIFADGIWTYRWEEYFKTQQHFFICPVCVDSLKNNEPLRQKVWADLTKKAKKGE